MGIVGKVSKDKISNARIERDRAENPVSAEPGMADDDAWAFDSGGSDSGGGDVWGGSDSWTGSGFGADSGGASDGFGGDSFGGGFGNGGFGDAGAFGGGGGAWSGFGTSFGAQTPSAFGSAQPQQSSQEMEDKIFDVVKKVCVGFISFMKELVTSLKTSTKHTYMATGRTMINYGAGATIVGLIFLFFSFSRSIGVSLIISGLLTAGLGIPIFMSMYTRIMESGGLEVDQNVPVETDPFADTGGFDSDPFSDEFSSEDSWGSADDSFDSDGWGSDEDTFEDDFEFSSEEDDSFDFSKLDDTDDSSFFTSDSSSTFDVAKGEAQLENIQITNGIYTRQYLYDLVTSVLPSITRNFSDIRPISESSEEFDAWNAVIHETAVILRTKEDVPMPYLVKADERLMYYLLTVKRVSWLKNLQAFVDEIVKIYAYDEGTNKMNEKIYGSAEAVGDYIYITIMRGETATVTNKDIYEKV